MKEVQSNQIANHLILILSLWPPHIIMQALTEKLQTEFIDWERQSLLAMVCWML